jgi:CheY-like chemotaxis protein
VTTSPSADEAKILLIDDYPSERSHHRRVFGERLDVLRTIGQLEAALATGDNWTVAFVDFDLGSGEMRGGLTALRLLRESRPQTRLIVYTDLGGRGRTLFAAAAWHWFGVRDLLDKPTAEPEELREAARTAGHATSTQWASKLSRSAHLIDTLFRTPKWRELWVLWPNIVTYSAAYKVIPNLPHAASRTFQERASDAAEWFSTEFFGSEPTSIKTIKRETSQRATPLAVFATKNRDFFAAGDLADILDYIKPWNAPRSRG